MIRTLVPLAAFLAGGAVMVVEILGVRLISPVFGTGLHVWSALIAVALAALSVGYFVGGRLADRRPSPRLFFLLVSASGLGVVILPLYAHLLIPAFEPVGLRAGALLAATVTFLPPFILLGMTSPFAVRISAPSLGEVGGTAGRLYALSTLGSVAGTLAAGFLLAPLLRIDTTLRIVGLLVALPGIVGLLAGRRRSVAAGVALLLAGLFATPVPKPDGPPGDLVFRGDTPFQRVEVLDREGERWLLLDGCVHTHMEVGEGAAVTWGYVPLFKFLPGYRPEARSLLVLGLGGGAILTLHEAEEYEATIVEIDPVVVRAAREHFGTLTGREEVHVGDVRPFVRREKRTWDLVALDVCGSDRAPEHLTTVEFFRELKGIMAPDGVLAMNSIGALEGRSLSSLSRTIGAVFTHVIALASHPEGPLTNVIYYASDGPLDLSWAFEDEADRLRVDLLGGSILTDQWNPINLWNARWAREIRRTRRERY